MSIPDLVFFEGLKSDILKLSESGYFDIAPNKMGWVNEYLDAGEYGLAFSNLCAIALKENKPNTEKIRSLIADLAERMELDDDEESWLLHWR